MHICLVVRQSIRLADGPVRGCERTEESGGLMLRVRLGNGRDGIASHKMKNGVERFETKDWKLGLDTLGLRTSDIRVQC